MAEPVSSGLGGFIVFKAASGVAAVFGAMSMYSWWQPKRLVALGKTTAFMIVCGMGGASGVMLTGGLAMYFGLDRDSVDVGLSLGFCSGILSVFLISLIANFARAREDKDILEVVTEVRNVIKPTAKRASKVASKAARKPAAKKTKAKP